jgi:hypothetical protein
MAEAETGKRMETLFQKVLMGRSSWSQQDKLPTELKKIWEPQKHRLLGQIDAEGKENLRLARSFVSNDMQHFDNIQKEAATIPAAVRGMLKSIRRKVPDPDDPSKFYTEVKEGEEAYMIEQGQKMVRTGNMTAAQAISTMQTATLDDMEKKDYEAKQHAEALAAIPGKKGWILNKDDVDAALIAVENALKIGVSEKDIIATLQGQGWKDDVIPNLFPKDAKPVVAQASTKSDLENIPLDQLRDAVKEDPERREEAREIYNRKVGA